MTHDLEIAKKGQAGVLVLIDGQVLVDTTDFSLAAEALHRRALTDEVMPPPAENAPA